MKRFINGCATDLRQKQAVEQIKMVIAKSFVRGYNENAS